MYRGVSRRCTPPDPEAKTHHLDPEADPLPHPRKLKESQTLVRILIVLDNDKPEY